MTEISENPVLNPRAAAQLRFETLEPEIQPEIPERLALPAPPEEPEASSAAPEGERKKSPGRPRNSPNPGRHRKLPADPPVDDKAERVPAPPKIRPPDFREWHDFGANFVFKWLCRGYVGYVFKGIDKERVLNAAELDALEPDAEMLSSATKPFAHMAARSDFMKKNGRVIIDSADSIEALIAVGMYANTVRRIARSHNHERQTPQPSQRKKKNNGRVTSLHSHDSEPVREQPGRPDVPEAEERRIRVVNGESGFGSAGFGVGG